MLSVRLCAVCEIPIRDGRCPTCRRFYGEGCGAPSLSARHRAKISEGQRRRWECQRSGRLVRQRATSVSITKAMVLRDLCRVAEQLQVAHPTYRQYQQRGLFNIRHVTAFGSWSALCREAGMDYYIRTRLPEITLMMLVEDVKNVARRIGQRHVSYPQYQREGSYGIAHRIMQRNGELQWSDVCRMAGLLVAREKCPCTRCAKPCIKTGPGHDGLCKDCRRTVRKRISGESPELFAGCRGFQRAGGARVSIPVCAA